MNEELAVLIDLQKLDTLILRMRRDMDSIPERISSEEGPIKEARESYDKAKERHASLEKKKKDKEREIEDINERIKKQEQRTSDIKKNEEYQAHLREIEKTRTRIRVIEDELLVIMDELEGSARLLAAESVRIDEGRAVVDGHKSELEKQVQGLRSELDDLKQQRTAFVEKLPPDTYKLYTIIMKANRGVAVVEARDEICLGCNLHIPPQMFVEIKSNSEITHCPECRCILYYVKPDPSMEPSVVSRGGRKADPSGAKETMKGFIGQHSR